MKNLLITASLSTTLLSLGACSLFTNPNAMPSGYTYHHNEYKSPEASAPKDIGYDYTREKNAATLDQWKAAAADIVARLEGNASINKQPIFLSSPENTNVFALSLDNALREEFRARGYYLSAMPTQDSLKIAAYAQELDVESNIMADEHNADLDKDAHTTPTKKVQVTILSLINETPHPLAEQTYDLPVYGYKKSMSILPTSHNHSKSW